MLLHCRVASLHISPLVLMNPPEDALQQWLQFVHSLKPTLAASTGYEKKEYLFEFEDRNLTKTVLEEWRKRGLNKTGNKLVLRGRNRLYGVSPMPQNRGILKPPAPMLTVENVKTVSLITMLQGLRPSTTLFTLLLELQGQKTICIYKNQPEQGYPCSFVLPSITPARLNLPIDQYLGKPVNCIDSLISGQRRYEMEAVFQDYQDQQASGGVIEIPVRRQFLSTFEWQNMHWELINRTWYSPEDDAFVVTIADPPNQKGLRQRAVFLDMIGSGFAEPTPSLPATF